MHMSEAAEQSNWLSKVIFARNWEERSIVDAWNSCDALVCMAIRDLTLIPPALLAKFRDHSKPVVVSESNALGLGLDCVMDDSSAAMRLLAAAKDKGVSKGDIARAVLLNVDGAVAKLLRWA